MKILGFVTLLALAICGAGYINANLTDKGTGAVNDMIDKVKGAVDSEVKDAANDTIDGISSGLGRMKIDSAPSVSVAVEAKQ